MPLEQRRLGQTDIMVSSLCLGTMMYGDQMDEAGAFRQMDRSLEFGINFFDTAELYTVPPKPETHGESERIVGRWLKERGKREDIILATKVIGRTTRMPYLRDGAVGRVTRDQVTKAVDDSLKRMGTDYIDLYQLHWPDRNVPIFGAELKGFKVLDNGDTESFDAQLSVFFDLIKEGKIRTLGLSNETPYGVMSFLAAAERLGGARVVSVQNAYNLVNRYFEYGLAEVAMAEQVGLLAYSPIGQGALTGKYLGGAKPEGSRGQMFGRLGRYETPSAETAIKAYVDLAAELGVTPAVLAMQFVTTRPWVTSNIFGASSDAQLDEIFASVEMPWTDEVMEKVNALHAQLPNPCP